MSTMPYVDVAPAKLVQVLADDAWHDGFLRGWRQTEGRWRGYVTYTVGVGLRHVCWVDQDQLRHAVTTGTS